MYSTNTNSKDFIVEHLPLWRKDNVCDRWSSMSNSSIKTHVLRLPLAGFILSTSFVFILKLYTNKKRENISYATRFCLHHQTSMWRVLPLQQLAAVLWIISRVLSTRVNTFTRNMRVFREISLRTALNNVKNNCFNN